MQNENTQKVLDFLFLVYVRQVNSFIGLPEYFPSHVYGDLLEVMRPLRKLVTKFQTTKTKIKSNELPGAEESFLTTKELIFMRPKLFFCDETAPIFLLTDASVADYLSRLVKNLMIEEVSKD